MYLANIFQGDLGSTFRGQSIASQLTDAFPITIRLALIAIIFETIFGILAGVISGLRKGKIGRASCREGVQIHVVGVPANRGGVRSRAQERQGVLEPALVFFFKQKTAYEMAT